MATSMFQKLTVRILPLASRLLKYSCGKNWESVSTVTRKACRCMHPRLLTTAGTTYGISYAFLGYFKFWKKDEEETDRLTQVYRGARLAHAHKDLQKADELYHEALKVADEMVKAKLITQEKFLTAQTLMYDGLADIALQTGQLESAENLFKETMKGCLMQGMDQNHNVLVEIALKLASIYAIQGRKDEAEEGYKYCLNAQQPKMEATEKLLKAKDAKKGKLDTELVPPDKIEESEQDTAALLGMALSSYGRFLLYERRYKEALPMFEKARFYAEHTLGVESNQYLVVLNDIATLYIVTKNLDQAEKVLKDGIELSEKHKLGEGAMLYCNLGAVYLRKGDASSAIQQCQLGLDAAKTYDHKMAFKMAQACLKKGVSAEKQKQNPHQESHG